MNITRIIRAKPDPTKIKTLIEALRSGKYQQSTGVLRDDSGCHCIMGVAIDIFDPSRWTRPAPIGHDYQDFDDLMGAEPGHDLCVPFFTANDKGETFASMAADLERCI